VQLRAECGVKSPCLKKRLLCSVSGHTLILFSSTLCMSYFFIFREQRKVSDEFLKLETGELCVRERDDGHNHSTACSLSAFSTPG